MITYSPMILALTLSNFFSITLKKVAIGPNLVAKNSEVGTRIPFKYSGPLMWKQQRVMDMEEAEGLFPFPTYECAYYVQSPSSVSHANSNHEPPSTSFLHHPTQQAISTYTLSRHSSRASNNSLALLPQNANGPDPVISDDAEKRLIVFDGNMGGGDDKEDADEQVYYQEKVEWWRYFSFGYNPSSNAWILLQISWRMMVSLGVALLVFYLATKPPKPDVSVKVI